MLKLYDYFRSSASFRVRIALNIKGLNYTCVPIHLINNGGEQHTEDYKKINPLELVPALQIENRLLTQSLAIIEYLDEVQPTPPLLPIDPYMRALIRSFALTITADIHPLNNLRVLNYLTSELQADEAQKKEWYQHWVEKGLSALETQLTTSRVSGDFCFGDNPTLADICLVPQLFNARRFNCDISVYPTLLKVDNHCQKLSAFTEAWPKEAVT